MTIRRRRWATDLEIAAAVAEHVHPDPGTPLDTYGETHEHTLRVIQAIRELAGTVQLSVTTTEPLGGDPA